MTATKPSIKTTYDSANNTLKARFRNKFGTVIFVKTYTASQLIVKAADELTFLSDGTLPDGTKPNTNQALELAAIGGVLNLTNKTKGMLN